MGFDEREEKRKYSHPSSLNMTACDSGPLAERTGQKLNMGMETEVDQGCALGKLWWRNSG